jgi:pimeloyl-ACP methyl ester carboxylesterase
MTRTEVEFGSGDGTCRAWRYTPDAGPAADQTAGPCVVMAHGFGGTRDAGLEPYAERFVAAGLHVLLFDYRHFGASRGEPRQLLSLRRQLEDYANAVEFARALSGVDPDRVAVWGTSLSGGHAFVTAARIGGLAAAVCQCPMMDGLAALRELRDYAGSAQLLKLTAHGLLDACAAIVGRAHYVPIVGAPSALAMMTSADAEPGYRAIMPEGFRAEVAARVALAVGFYRPVSHAGRVSCPVLVQVCERDSVAPVAAAEAAIARLGARGHARRYPIGHFDPYVGEAFERSVGDQLEFLLRHLRG